MRNPGQDDFPPRKRDNFKRKRSSSSPIIFQGLFVSFRGSVYIYIHIIYIYMYTWNSNQPLFTGRLVISNHFSLVMICNHPTEVSPFKTGCLGYQVYVYKIFFKAQGIQRLYFPLESFRKRHFSQVACPANCELSISGIIFGGVGWIPPIYGQITIIPKPELRGILGGFPY